MGRISTALASAPPPRTPERQRLADCITRLEHAKAELAQLQEAEQRHFDERLAADRDLDAAQRRLADLQADHDSGNAELDAFLGNAGELERLRAAQRAVESLTAQAEKHDRISAALRNRIRAAEERVAVLEGSLRAAKLAAVATDPAIANLMARWAAARRTLLELRPLMRL
jgi:chromosome segregation ATPase